MKGILFLLGMMGLMLGISGGQKADAGVNVAGSVVTPNVAVSLSYFEDELAPYGRWVDVESYGRAWSPYGVANDWRPYWDGSWAYTDYGWTWVSYEPFGWATYHYGRWVFDPYYGWIWIPDTVWGPAWVTWHYNDNWCGWAPLPPSAGWSVSVGFHWVNHDYYIPSHSWCFVETNRFYDYNMRYACAPVARNAYLYDRTWDATRYSTYKGRPVNRGFDVERVEKWTGKRVERENIADLAKSRGKFAERAQLSREQIRSGENRSALVKERGRERKLNADQARQFQNRARRQEIDARELRQEQRLQSRGRELQGQRQEQRLQSRGRERQLEAQRQEQRLQSRGRERQLEAQRQEQRFQSRGQKRQLEAQRQEQRLQSRGRELQGQRQERRLQSRGRERQLEAQRQEQRLQSRSRERQLQGQRQEQRFQSRGRERQMNTEERQLQNKGRGARRDASDSPRRIQRHERKAPTGSTVVESQERPAKGKGKANARAQ